MSLRIVFFGTAELARVSLSQLADHSQFLPIAVVSQPDRAKGRELKLQPTPVKIEALKRGLTVLQPQRARDPKFVEELRLLSPELIVVAAYGQILPASILDLPRYGCLNVHASLLPKYRGAAPIQWAILDDESVTGVTIMKMDPGLDTGDILTQETVPILKDDTSETLHEKLAHTGAALLISTIPNFIAGNIAPRPQPAVGATYARKIAKEDGRLDWKLPARVLWNRVRAFTPWPGAFSYLSTDPRRPLFKIWKAEPESFPSGIPGEIVEADRLGIVVRCGAGALRILQLQLEGGRRMTAQEFLAGHPLRAGQVLE